MQYLIYVFALAICGFVYYLVQHQRTKAIHQQIVQREGCQPLKCLPNPWFPPLGLDKLRGVIEAERAKRYPLFMVEEHEKHGDSYCQWSGPLYTIITRDTRNIREMLSRQFKNFEVGDGRHGCVRPLLGDGIFTQDGAKWETSRKLLAPMIHRPTLPDLGLIERHFQRLHSRIADSGLNPKGPASQAIGLKEYLFDLSLQLTTEFLLGEDISAPSQQQNQKTTGWNSAFAIEFEAAFQWISKRERLKAFYWLIDGFSFRKSCNAARNLVDELLYRSIERRKLHDMPTETYIALEPLLSGKQDVGFIRDQFINLLLAGRDTSGALLCWVFYVLAREPSVFEFLRKEVEETLGTDESRTPTKNELNGMVKLDQFMTEILRLFPPVPLNGRFCVKDTFLPHGGGDDGEAPILVPAGTLIAFSTFAAQHNKDLYGETANRFCIDRWDDARTKERRMVDWTYHPFIGGPRKCLGERFAVTQAKYLTCRALQYYEKIIPTDAAGNALPLESDGSWIDKVQYHVGLTMSPDAGVWVRMVPRHQD